MKPKLAEEKAKQVEAARQEALENAIAVVKQKIKDQLEAEKAATKTDTGQYWDLSATYIIPSSRQIFLSVLGPTQL